MGAIIVLTPALIAAWPVVSTSILGAAAAMGFAQVGAGAKPADRRTTATLDVEGSQVVAGSLGEQSSLAFERDGVTLTFAKDARGRCQVKCHGALPHEELVALGEEFAGQVVQQYAYHQLMGSLETSGFGVIEQETSAEGTIHVRVRRFD